MIGGLRARPALLALLPLATYVVSYAYLAWYHDTLFLFGTIVHESGRYTLLENTFYAPHFLGHIPVLLTLSLLMVGSYRWFTPDPAPPSRRDLGLAISALVLLVGVSLVFSLTHWGSSQTWEFILQERQRPDLLVPGGSWLLHLPSTLSLILGLPLTVIAWRWFFRLPTGTANGGLAVFGLGITSAVAMTWLVVPQPLATSIEVLCDPLTLGHAVRELATFPLTYFPFPLAWWFAHEPIGSRFRWTPKLIATATIVGVAFAAAFAYQVWIPLETGVSDLAQSPDFAHDGALSIPYLLASHFFEHFLDTVFFALLCVLLMIPGDRQRLTRSLHRVSQLS